MSICGNALITKGIGKSCADINASIGVEKDLILVNYDDFDKEATLAASNMVPDGAGAAGEPNECGLSNIILKAGANQYIFEGTDYSVIPTVTPEVREDGTVWYLHSILFTAYSKTSETRKTIEKMGSGLFIAIATDRSTGFVELFGADQGLRMTNVERAYVGSQNSNFYNITLSTPDIAVMRESTLGQLAVGVRTL